MIDQAEALRTLVRSKVEAISPRPARARSLVFTGGKGGVGTSNLALNVAIALAEAGQRVVLVDADLGLANLDLLCGLAPSRDLGDVLEGAATLAEAIVTGPAGVRIVPGAHGSRTLPEALADAPPRLAAELSALEREADFLIVDAGGGLNPNVSAFAEAADLAVVIATPEPTALADTHAALRRLGSIPGPGPSLRAIVNQAATEAEGLDCLDRLAASSRQFFGLVVRPLGCVRADPRVPASVRAGRPFAVAYPRGPASKGVRRLARALIADRLPKPPRPGLFAAIAARIASG